MFEVEKFALLPPRILHRMIPKSGSHLPEFEVTIYTTEQTAHPAPNTTSCESLSLNHIDKAIPQSCLTNLVRYPRDMAWRRCETNS